MAPNALATRVQPQRKRAETSYCESNSDGSDSDEYSEKTFTAVPTNKKRKISTSTAKKFRRPKTKPKPEPKPDPIFPWARLPPELRNQIYSIALTDPVPIFLTSKSRTTRRTLDRRRMHGYDVHDGFTTVYAGFPNARNSQRREQLEQPANPARLIPSILRLCRTIHDEAISMLYVNNTFTFQDTTALHTFLANIRPNNIARLTSLTFKGYGWRRGNQTPNFAALTLLSHATNLTRLHFDCRVTERGGPRKAAAQLYKDGCHWMEAVGIAKGKADAAVEMIEVLDANFDILAYLRGEEPNPGVEECKVQFQEELSRLLRAH